MSGATTDESEAGTVPGLRVVDLTVGPFGVVLPTFEGQVFFRLERPVGGPIDRARRAYLMAANAQLRAGTGRWIDGPGIATGADGASDLLRGEIEAVASAIRVLGEEERFARAYLELHVDGTAAVDADTGQAGTDPDLRTTRTKRRV